MIESGEEQKAKITLEELDAWVAELGAQYDKCEKMQKELSEENKKAAILEGKIAQALKETGRDKYQTPKGTFYFRRAWRFNLPEKGEPKKLFIQWLRDKGIADEYLTVNSNSYNSLLNQEREAAIRDGRFLDVPGVPEPKLYETIGFKGAKE